MADRSVSVRLRLNIASFEAGSKAAGRNLSGLNKKLAETAGFATGMRRKLEDAVKKLPKIEIDANSKPAEIKVAALRAKLEKLSAKEIGIDIDASAALIEMAELQQELRALEQGASFDVRADIGNALADLESVAREVQRINGQKVEIDIEADRTFAERLRSQVEQAARSLPKISIDADSTPAQRQIAELRSRLELLASKRVGVDVDADAAMAEIAAIQRDLQRLNASSTDVQVRADSAAALAQLRAVQAETSRLDGRTASVRVNADVSGALMGIAAVGAALASLPAVASIGLGVGALGAAFGAAGAGALAFGAVAGPSLGRVNEALKGAESSAGGAGGAMKSAGQKAAEAAASALRLAEAQDRVRDAGRAVRDAQRGVSDALRDVRDKQDALRAAQEAAGLASERVSLAAEAGARRIADAERSVADAHRATQRAVEDLTRARERAQEKLEDLALATEGGALAEERAQISLKRAQQNLARVSQPGSGASQTDKEDAELAVREAEFAVRRLKESNADLAQERAKADAQGVEGSDEVRAAKEAVEAATRREADAERAVADARTQAARDVTAAQRDAAAAARDVAMAQRDVRDAMRDVSDAQRKVSDAERDQLRAKQRLRLEQLQQKAALEQTGGAAGGAATKMSKLSEAEKELAKDIKKFTDAYEDWQRDLQPDVFPVIRKGMDLLTTGMKIGTPLVKASAGAFGQFLDTVNTELQGEQWGQFFDELTEQAPRAIEGLGNATLNVAGGLAGVVQAFLPYTGDLMTWVEDITQKFETWGQGLGDSSEFKAFIQYAQENGPKVAEIIGNVAEAVGKILQAGSGTGADVLDFLVALSEKLAGMDPAQVEAIAKGVAGIFAAAKLGATLKVGAFVLLAEVLSKMSPGQIQAVALAVAGVIIAVKGYQAVSGAVGFWQNLSGGIGKAGKAADGATGKLDGLGGKLGGLSGVVSGGALAGGLLILGDRFAKAADEAARFADVTAARGGSELEGQIRAVTDEIEKMRGQVGFAVFDTLYFSDESKTAADKLEGLESKLSDLKHQYELQSIAAGQATEKVDVFQQSLSTFAGRTDYMQAIRNMQTAYEDAATAVGAANGKLDTNAKMTDAQRDAVIKAREKFGGYLETVRTGALAQEKLSGRTGDATLAVARQLDKLFDLAGKSKEAREQVYLLAEKFGISREQADKATRGAKGLKEMLAQLKNPKLKIELETAAAKAKLMAFAKEVLGIKMTLPEGIAAPAPQKPKKPNAWGGISHADGREYMAMGGIRSAGSSPSAMIAKQPYMISGRSGPDVIYGEAGWEAYIPLDSSKRGRGLQVLGEAASAMGMAVVPQQVGAGSAPAWTSGGALSGASGAMVSVTGIDALKGSLDATSTALTGSLAEATSAVTSTLGEAGSVTSALERMAETLDAQLTKLTSAVESLSGAVAGAGAVAAAAQGKIGSAASAKAKSSTGKIGTAVSATAGGKSKIGTAISATASKGKAKGVGSAGTSLANLAGIDGALAAAAKKKVQINMISGSNASAPVQNSSKVSKPVQAAPKMVATTVAGGSGSTDYTRTGSGTSSGSGPLVAMYGTVMHENADVDRFAAQLSMRVDGRG